MRPITIIIIILSHGIPPLPIDTPTSINHDSLTRHFSAEPARTREGAIGHAACDMSDEAPFSIVSYVPAAIAYGREFHNPMLVPMACHFRWYH
jgi:hypothetical protein